MSVVARHRVACFFPQFVGTFGGSVSFAESYRARYFSGAVWYGSWGGPQARKRKNGFPPRLRPRRYSCASRVCATASYPSQSSFSGPSRNARIGCSRGCIQVPSSIRSLGGCSRGMKATPFPFKCHLPM